MSNIIDNLVRMKNLTSIMVKLAYSDLFYTDTDLSKFLEEMNLEIRNLEKDTLKHVFRIRESDELRINILELMEYVKDIGNACMNITVLKSKGRVLPFTEKMINSSEERAILVKVRKSSILTDKTISETKVRTHTGANIRAIKRNGKWNFHMNKKTILKKDDVIFAVGNADAKKLFTKVAEGTLKTVY